MLASEINIGYHPDGFRIDKTTLPINKYTSWLISAEGEWEYEKPVCFHTLPEDGWLPVEKFDWPINKEIR